MEVWKQFDHDPRIPANTTMRASDRDRAVIETVLADAFAEGRLTRSEYDERAEAEEKHVYPKLKNKDAITAHEAEHGEEEHAEGHEAMLKVLELGDRVLALEPGVDELLLRLRVGDVQRSERLAHLVAVGGAVAQVA